MTGKRTEGMRTLTEEVGFTVVDIGARGGAVSDLKAIAPSADYYGFEPDAEECERLNREGALGWKSARFFPVALGGIEGELDINLYAQRGCSSALKVREGVGERFSRGQYYALKEVVRVPATTLDGMVREGRIGPPAFMKIDVQGMETECFAGARQSLGGSLVGIRTEVSFYSVYEGQALWSDVDDMLRPFGFVPMRFLELHEWRRKTMRKWPLLKEGDWPYSRGQMIHADVLYLMEPEYLRDQRIDEPTRMLRLAIAAMCYDQFDHASAACEHPEVRQWVIDRIGLDPMVELRQMSRDRVVGRSIRFTNLLSRIWRRVSSGQKVERGG